MANDKAVMLRGQVQHSELQAVTRKARLQQAQQALATLTASLKDIEQQEAVPH